MKSSNQANDAGEVAALEAMEACRRASIDLGAAVGYNTPIYRLTTELQGYIDNIAEILTGNREHFWDKRHSTPGPALKDGERWRDHTKMPMSDD